MFVFPPIKQLIASLSGILLFIGLSAPAAWSNAVAVGNFQIKVVDPRTDIGQSATKIWVISLTETGKTSQELIANSAGTVNVSLTQGTHVFKLEPNSNDAVLMPTTHIAEVSANGSISFESGISTITQPFLLPFEVANVWGLVSFPSNPPSQDSGVAVVDAYNTDNGEIITKTATPLNQRYGINLYPGTWQIKARWSNSDETNDLIHFGPSDPVTIVVDDNQNVSNFSTTSGLTLALKAPTITGTIALPDNTRISGWRIFDPDPNWVNIKEERTPYIDFRESSNSLGLGQFALWVNPAYKPSQLRFSVVSNGVGYSKTVDIPAFTTTLNLGTILAEQSNKMVVNLGSSAFTGTLSLQKLNLNTCNNCWNSIEDESVEGKSEISFYHIKTGDTYRVVYQPNYSETQYLTTISSSIIVTASTTNVLLTPTVVALKQFKVLDPRTNTGVLGAQIVIAKDDKSFYKSAVTDSEGIALIGAPSGTYRLVVTPPGDLLRLQQRNFELAVAENGNYTISNNISATTSPIIIPLGLANVWGNVTRPADAPSNIYGGVQIQFIRASTGDVHYSSTGIPGSFVATLTPGTWQVKTIPFTKSTRIYSFGPAETATVVVNSDGTSNLEPSGSGLTLALKAPNVIGIITKPDGTRVSGWRVEDPDPDWVKIKEMGGFVKPINGWESQESTAQGEFALWIDPAHKPKSLRFTLESESEGYGKTISIPDFTTTLNLGTIAAVQANNLRVNLPNNDIKGTVRLEQRRKNECESCWTSHSAGRSYETSGLSSVNLHILPDSNFDYRIVFDPGSEEFRYMSTATSALTLPIPSSGFTMALNVPSLIGRIPSLSRSPSKSYFAEVILLREQSNPIELVAKGLPPSRWYAESTKYLYNSPNFAFTLESGVNYRLFINPGSTSQTSPIFITNTIVGPTPGTTLGEVTFTPGPANLSGVVSSNGSPLPNQTVKVIGANRTWDLPFTTMTDDLGKYYFNLPPETYSVSIDINDLSSSYSSKTVNCQVIYSATKLDCNLALPQKNFWFKPVDVNGNPVKVWVLRTKIDDVTNPAATILPLEKYFNSDLPPPRRGDLDSDPTTLGVFLENGRHLVTTSAQFQGSSVYAPGFFEVIVANQSVVSVRNMADGTALTAISNIYALPLPTPNISGILNLDGERVKKFYGYALTLDPVMKGRVGTNKFLIDGDGKFYDYQLPGNYFYDFRTFVAGSDGETLLKLKNCITTSLMAQVTCNLTLTQNFKGLVRRSNGEIANQGNVHIYERRSDSSLNYYSWSNLGNSGAINVALVDGDYEFHIKTGANDIELESSRIWVDVREGVVTRVTNRNSTISLSQAENRYQINTAFVGIAGTVVAPNGITPIANASVMAYSDRGGWGESSRDTGRFVFPSIDRDGIWRLEADAPKGNRVEMGRSNPVNVTVLNGVGSSDVVLTLRATTLRGTVFGSAGAIKGGWVEFRRLENNNTGQWSWAGGVVINEQGQFGAVLAPGTYYYVARPDDSTHGVTNISGACIVPSTGFTTCDTTLAQPNFSAKILKSDGEYSINSSYFAFKKHDKTTLPNSISVLDVHKDLLDNQGRLRLNLSDGEWNLLIHPGPDAVKTSYLTAFRIVVENNQITTVESLASNTPTLIPAVGGVYALTLKSVNLVGQVTFQGKSDSFNSLVRVVREVSTEDGTWYDHFGSSWTRNEGRFEINVEPGNYQLEVIPYIWDTSAFTTGIPSFTRKLNCVVPLTGQVTCDVALNSANLLGKVTDAAGVARRESYINVYKSDANGNQVRVDRGIRVDGDAHFASYLEDGTYQITIAPYWEYRLNLIERSYRVTVAGGVVTEVMDLTTNLSLTKDGSNRFVLKFGTPSVMGSVLMPGASTETVANIRIEVLNTNNNILWQYQTYTNSNGQFSLALPDGNYLVRAINDGKVRNAYKSAPVAITVTNATAPALTLRLRDANLTGVVVLPGTTTPVANVHVNIYVDGEWHYTWTDETGTFGMFVEKESPNCPNKCSVHFNTWSLPGYLPKNYPISSLGNLGNLAIGIANTKVSVLAPLGDGTTTNNVGGWLRAERLATNGSVVDSSWGNIDKSGFAYFSFEQGARYRIYANPGYELTGKYAAKTFEIASHNQTSDQVTYTITFDAPNLNLTVRGWDGLVNSWGYYRVLNSSQQEVAQGSLNFGGQAALSISTAGNYTMVLYPGKSKGVVKTVAFSVVAGEVTSSEFSVTDRATTIDLPRGNVEGLTRYHDGTIAKEVLITAVRSDDATIVAKTSSSESGKYFLNLERSYTWNISFFDPQTSRVGNLALASTNEAPAPTLNNLNLDFAVPTP